MAQNGSILGYFSARTQAESAISALKDAGFTRNQIGLAIRSGAAGTASSTERPATGGHQTGAHAEGLSAWDKIRGFFSSETVEPYAGEATGNRFDDREVSPPGYTHEDVGQSLGGLSQGDEQSRYFQHRFGSGDEGVIVTVNADGREAEVRHILEENGGDIGSAAAGYDYGTNQGASDVLEGEQNIQLYGEVLRVHTDRVSRGEVRLRKEVHTDTQTVEVPVTREELVVERTVPTGERAATGTPSFENQEIRVPLSEDRAYVEKQPIVREEVRVGKKAVSDVETFDEQVRSEDLKVDEDTSGRKSA